MKNSLLFFLLIFSTGLFAQKKGNAVSDSLFAHYKKLNEAETALPEYKDDDGTLKLKIAQLAIINNSREKKKAQPVQLDILCSRVANKMCQEACENNYMGHFNMAGEKPYHRYAFAGGKDHVAENASARWGENMQMTDEYKAESMKILHGEFMAERAPNDGHKQNCINKNHNFIGIGLWMNENRLCYYEEFIDRYLTFGEIPEKVKPKEEFSISVTVPKGWYLVLSLAYYEKELKKMSAKKIDRIDQYEDFSKTETNQTHPWDLAKSKTDQTYTVNFKFDKPGLYYVQLLLDKKEITKEQSYDSKKWIQASGIVIRCE